MDALDLILRLHKDGHITTEEAKMLMERVVTPEIKTVPISVPEPYNPPVQPYYPYDPMNPYGPVTVSYTHETTRTFDNSDVKPINNVE